MADNFNSIINGNTIAAISTAPGTGGVAVIRISGNNAISACKEIFKPLNKSINLQQALAGKVIHGLILDESGETLDDVLLVVFRTPHSYTGEDVVEISCHGSLFIQHKILELLLKRDVL
jgi:tRNA modification GTPase